MGIKCLGLSAGKEEKEMLLREASSAFGDDWRANLEHAEFVTVWKVV